MNIRLHKSLLAGAIAAVLATPAWSAGTHEEGSEKSGASSERYESEHQRSQGAASTTSERGSTDYTGDQQGLSGVGAGATGAAGTSGMSGSSGSSDMSGTSSSSGLSATSGSSSLSSSAGAQSELQQKTPDDLEGMKVVGVDNEQIGKVEKVVRSRQDDTIFAVVSFGGMLGMGESKVLVPLNDLKQGQEDDQQLQISKTKDELKTAERYDEERYTDLEPKDRPISEFARFETRPQGELGESESGVTEQRIQREKPGDIESRQGQQGSQGIGTSPGGGMEE